MVQESILGRLILHDTVHYIADDTNLLYSDKYVNNLKRIIDNELKLLFEWLCENLLSLNCDNTESIIFIPSKNLCKRTVLKLNGLKIYESNKIKYLESMLLNQSLYWI